MNAKTFMALGGYDDEQNVSGSGHFFFSTKQIFFF